MTAIANNFATAIRANAESVKEKNKARADKLVLLVNDKACHALLKASKVDAERFANRALYATEKCVKIVYAASREVVSHDDLNENAFATIKTLINALDAKVNVTKRDIEAALSIDVKHDEKRAFVYRRKARLSAATLSAQSQQCVDMIKTLKIAREVATNVFEVQDNALMQHFKKQFADIAL